MLEMVEILAEIRIRLKNEITIPGVIRDMLNLSPSDLLRFELIEGNICMYKVITRKVNNKNVGGEDAVKEVDTS